MSGHRAIYDLGGREITPKRIEEAMRQVLEDVIICNSLSINYADPSQQDRETARRYVIETFQQGINENALRDPQHITPGSLLSFLKTPLQ